MFEHSQQHIQKDTLIFYCVTAIYRNSKTFTTSDQLQWTFGSRHLSPATLE
jgi:hypothetical protein